MAKTISVICPLYNASEYIKALHQSLLNQKDVNIAEIKYILTECQDSTEKMLKELHCNYQKIHPKEFSHSLTREQAAFNATGDIIVFITQDIEIKNQHFLKNLTSPISSGEVAATYARQISKYDNIEKYTRENNYPEQSFTVSKADISRLGLKTFFFSDAACAINTNIFRELKGYDKKDLPFSEDMYFAHKLIMHDYKIGYCAEAQVYHSHKLSLKQLYNRYKLTGEFMKQNPAIKKYGTTSSGASLAKYILRRIIQDHKIKLLLNYPFDMAARYLGMKAGERTR